MFITFKPPTTTNGYPSHMDNGIVYSPTKYRETEGIKEKELP